MTAWPEPVTLKGDHATLVPMSMSHEAALSAAVREGELWRLWYTSVPSPEEMAKFMAQRLAQQEEGRMCPFTVLDARGEVVGMTTYLQIDAVNKRLEIGGTWYAKRVQRSALNTECKLMLLRHAFESLDCIAVEFRTHRLNSQSRRAIERLGAQFDGILRAHQRTADGNIRDTAVYSVIAPEWPVVKTHLEWQLQRPR